MNGASAIVLDSFSDFWAQFTGFIPTLLLAIGLLFAGFIFSWIFEAITKKVLRIIKLEEIVDRVGIKKLFEKAGMKMTFTRLFSAVVYWFVLIVFLAAVVNVLGLSQLSEFMDKLVAYIPNVIAAVAILIIGVLVANLLYSMVKNACESANLRSSHFLASLTKWSIFVFTFIATLVQLKVAPDLLKIFFTGFVVMVAIAGGLAFGLGGKDAAKDIIDKLRRG